MDFYPVFGAIPEIYVVRPYRCRRDHAYTRTVKQIRIAPGPCTYYQRVCRQDIIPGYILAVDISDIGIRLENTFEKRNVPVRYYSYLPFHNNL